MPSSRQDTVICSGHATGPSVTERRVAHAALPTFPNELLVTNRSWERGIIIFSPEPIDEPTKLMDSSKPTNTQIALVKLSGSQNKTNKQKTKQVGKGLVGKGLANGSGREMREWRGVIRMHYAHV